MLLRFLDIAREKCAWAVQGGKVLLCKGQSAVHRLRCNSNMDLLILTLRRPPRLRRPAR